jgi:hypothetical protein
MRGADQKVAADTMASLCVIAPTVSDLRLHTIIRSGTILIDIKNIENGLNIAFC